MTPVSAIPGRLLRTFSLSGAPRLPSQAGTDPDSPALSPEIELDLLLGPQQGKDGAASADHQQPADCHCQQISSVRRRVTQLTTTACALESPASTPSSSPITTPTLPLPWPSQQVAHLRTHRRNGSFTSVSSDTSSLSSSSGTASIRDDPRQSTRARTGRDVEAASVWRDFWS